MRDPETETRLQGVRAAVVEARQTGVTVRACVWDAAVAAVDEDDHSWPSAQARRVADDVCRAFDPPQAVAGPELPDPPKLARALFAVANYLCVREARRGA